MDIILYSIFVAYLKYFWGLKKATHMILLKTLIRFIQIFHYFLFELIFLLGKIIVFRDEVASLFTNLGLKLFVMIPKLVLPVQGCCGRK